MSLTEIVRLAPRAVPTDRAKTPGSFRKTDSAVGLRHRFIEQTKRTFVISWWPSLNLHAQMLSDGEHILIAATAEVDDEEAVIRDAL